MKIENYWIEKIKESKEFKVLAEVENIEVLKLNKAIEYLLDDQFIETATANGIARREKLLGLTPFADDSLEDRRFRILSRWNSRLPYTYRGLIEKLNQLCGENGYTINLNHGEYTLNIKIELTAKRMEQEVGIMARKMVPANILVSVELRYRQHKELKKYTNRELQAYRHRHLREEDLI